MYAGEILWGRTLVNCWLKKMTNDKIVCFEIPLGLQFLFLTIIPNISKDGRGAENYCKYCCQTQSPTGELFSCVNNNNTS